MTKTKKLENEDEADQFLDYEGIYHHVKRRKVIVKLFDLLAEGHSNLKVLDMGCGDGWYTQPLADKSHWIVGVDLSPKSIRRAKKLAKKADLILAEANNVPFRDHTFDIVVAAQFLEHMQNPLQAVFVLSCLTKRKGIVLIEVPSMSNLVDYIIMRLFHRKPNWGLTIDSTHKHFFSQEELIRLFRKCKLESVDVVGAVHLSYDLPIISSIVWDGRRRFWRLLDIVEQFLGMLKREWGSIQTYVLKKM